MDVNNMKQDIPDSETPRLVYEPPMLTRLEDCDIGTGDSNVPENNNGLLES